MENRDSDFHRRLENWARAVRVGFVRQHCASVEHKYRPERGEAYESRREAKIVVDYADAWLVEAAWRQLPMRQRWLLKGEYIMRRSPRMVIQVVMRNTGQGVKRHAYNSEVVFAEGMLRRLLDTRHTFDQHRQQFEIPLIPSVPMSPL